jgi:REP element-mobilizing transposase RayT
MQQKPKGWYQCNLPHLDAPEVIQAVTFRLYDSLPLEVIKKLKLTKNERHIKEVEKRRIIENHLDFGIGACWLKQTEIAILVENALLHFNPERYTLFAWCIMPNHVHVLIKTKLDFPLYKVVHSWKSFTATEANKILNRNGKFWQREYFDRYIRDEGHFWAVFKYIENNPIKIADKGIVKWSYSTCNYCSTGCAIEIGINKEGNPVGARGVAGADVNRGKLYTKGIFEQNNWGLNNWDQSQCQ